jgi:hypothetical protein
MLQYNEYLNIINESYVSNKPSELYWSSDFKKIENLNWTEFKTVRIFKSNHFYYKINFTVNNNQYYSVIFEKNTNNDVFYIEDNLTEKFESKLRSEFNKNKTSEVLKNVPKCLEDINKATKYNI